MQSASITASREARGLRQRWLAAAVIAGFIAIGASTAVLVLAYLLANGVGSPQGGGVRFWLWELTHNNVVSFSQAAPAVALALHVVFGLVWAILYARVVEPRLPRAWSGWQRGMAFGCLVWVLSWLVFLPAVGAGVGGAALGAGPLPIVGNLLMHLVYGGVLGQLYDPSASHPAVAADVAAHDDLLDRATAAQVETFEAAGIVVGAVIGACVGVALAVVLPPTLPAVDFGGWEVAMAVGGVLAGGAVGGVVGSFAGLPSTPVDAQAEATVPGQDPFQHVILPFLIPPFVAVIIAAIIVSMGTTLLRVAGATVSLPLGLELSGAVVAAVAGVVVIAVVALLVSLGQSSPSKRETVSHSDH